MLAFPPLSTTLLPSATPPPTALLYPSPLPLPSNCLLLGTVRLLLLPGLLRTLSLLLPGLLGTLSLLLLLAACLRLLSGLSALLLSRLLSLLPALLLLRLVLLFVLLVSLRVQRDNRPEKQKQDSDTRSFIELHGNLPPLRSLLGMHADD
jgi:hypothetical protein